jgi:hypothetical protein
MPPKAAFSAKTIGNIVDAESSYSKGKLGAVQLLCRRDAGAPSKPKNIVSRIEFP